MAAEWLFEGSGDGNEWRKLADRADDTLAAARQSLERVDPDQFSEGDLRALEAALKDLSHLRRELERLDRATLGDAESLLREILDRTRRPATLLAQRA